MTTTSWIDCWEGGRIPGHAPDHGSAARCARATSTALVAHHSRVYGSEYGVDPAFEEQVAASVARVAGRGFPTEREAICLVELDGEHAGSIALTDEGNDEAAVRWFLLDPELRGHGLGRRLVGEMLARAGRPATGWSGSRPSASSRRRLTCTATTASSWSRRRPARAGAATRSPTSATSSSSNGEQPPAARQLPAPRGERHRHHSLSHLAERRRSGGVGGLRQSSTSPSARTWPRTASSRCRARTWAST